MPTTQVRFRASAQHPAALGLWHVWHLLNLWDACSGRLERPPLRYRPAVTTHTQCERCTLRVRCLPACQQQRQPQQQQQRQHQHRQQQHQQRRRRRRRRRQHTAWPWKLTQWPHTKSQTLEIQNRLVKSCAHSCTTAQSVLIHTKDPCPTRDCRCSPTQVSSAWVSLQESAVLRHLDKCRTDPKFTGCVGHVYIHIYTAY